MKIYDFDGMFNNLLTDYMKKNSNKYTSEQWEDVIPKLYKKFGNTKIKSIGKTPVEYYSELACGELVNSLCTHVKKGIPVPKFLIDAIESSGCKNELLPLLKGSDEEAEYAVQLLGTYPQALNIYVDLLADENVSEDVKNRCMEYLKERADNVKEKAVNYYKSGIQQKLMLEVLSRCVLKDDEVFNILIKEFRTECDNLLLNTAYLAAYGDERALPYLLEKIEEEGLSYVEFRELKYAIECLGGEYKGQRDFSSDPYYELINSHSGSENIFEAIANGDKKE